MIRNDVLTKGGEGGSPVRGEVVHLKAFAFSIKPGTKGDCITVDGQVLAKNNAIDDWKFEAFSLGSNF